MGEDELFLVVPVPTTGFLMGVTFPILGIEVTQAIQDLKNSVLLVAGKTTFVRVYLDQSPMAATSPFAVPIPIKGELSWRRADGAVGGVSASMDLRPANPPFLAAQRQVLELSMNFQLPAEAIAPGTVTLRLFSLFESSSGFIPFTGTSSVTVEFKHAPVLQVRAIGLRYKTQSGAFVAPDEIHFRFLRSFLERAYPVAQVMWTQTVVDADFAPPFIGSKGPGPMTADAANRQLAAIRSTEVNPPPDPESGFETIGVDRRTHYYGLVGDNGGNDFFQGSAAIAPNEPRPDTVACGPAGVHNTAFEWDKDGSFADWYGAHELGHTFGRNHPGFPRGKQDIADSKFPIFEGQIGDEDNDFVGFDIGDASLGLSMQTLPGRIYHDVMTYADRQWLSKYTYEAIHKRLIEEETL